MTHDNAGGIAGLIRNSAFTLTAAADTRLMHHVNALRPPGQRGD
jgi:hypothetical protein